MQCLNHLFYADDAVLLVPTVDVIIFEMLNNGGTSGVLNFNRSKTKSMFVLNKTNTHPLLYFQNNFIEEESQHTHLGVVCNAKIN